MWREREKVEGASLFFLQIQFFVYDEFRVFVKKEAEEEDENASALF